MSKILITYFSKTGNTKIIGETIFKTVDGEKVIKPVKELLDDELEGYRLIFIGFPVHSHSVPFPVEAVLKNIPPNKKIAFFSTHGSLTGSRLAREALEYATVMMPKAMTGYHSVHLFDANHGQLGVVYAGETLEISPDNLSTTDKHIYALMRTSTDKGNEIANQAQDLVKIITNSNTPYVGPGYDEKQLQQAKRVLAGAASIVKAKTAYANELIPGTVILKEGADIDKYNYVVASLLGWALMPNQDAYYPQLVIKESECTTVNFPKPPVQYEKGGYWSFTAYGVDGYLHNNNSVISYYDAKANADGSYTVHVGNSEKCKASGNNIDMPKGGASISLRLYRPISIEAAKQFETDLQSNNTNK